MVSLLARRIGWPGSSARGGKTQRRRGKRRARAVNEGPCRRPHSGKPWRVAFVDTGIVEGFRNHRRKERKRRTRAVNHRDRESRRDLAPALPAVETSEVVGAHNPDKIDARIASLD